MQQVSEQVMNSVEQVLAVVEENTASTEEIAASASIKPNGGLFSVE